MPKSDKAKTAGKFVVVMLCFAILFFLLLPFLDHSETVGGQPGKKAIPQIFTSNPLSELVRKIYSMFTRNQQTDRARAASYAGARGSASYEAAAAEETRYSAENAAKGGSSTYSGGRYDYGDAGIINEDGEWVLVRQTAPDAAQRGMHEVNSSDTAYEKLVRLERAAKYTGHPAQTRQEYPDSKWARLWRPIKNFFTGQSEGVQAENAERPYALASASGGLGFGGGADGSTYANGTGGGLGGRLDSGAQADEDPGFFALLNPEYAISGVVDSLNELAENELSGEQLNKFKEQTKKMGIEKAEQIRAAFLNQIAQDAQGQEPETLLDQTYKCGDPSGQYGEPSQCTPPPNDEMRSQSIEAAEQKQRESLAELSRLAGKQLPAKDLNMIVILGTTDTTNPMEGLIPDEEEQQQMGQQQAAAGSPEEEKQQQRKILKEFYDFMLKDQGCDKETCFWVGAEIQPDPAMRNSVIGSGMNYDGDPLGLGQNFVARYTKQAEESGDENFHMINTSLSTHYPPYYYPVNKKNMELLNARNFFDLGDPKKPQKPTIALFPTAANAKEVIDKGGWQYAGLSIYGDGILDKSNNLTTEQRSDLLRGKLVDQAKRAKALAQGATQDLSRFGTTVLMQSVSTKVMKQIQEDANKKNPGAVWSHPQENK